MADTSVMTMAREIIPGGIHLLTRRCAQRMFLLRPEPETKAIFGYCLGVAAKRCNIGVIAWCAMSNHYHAVVHDPDGRLPEFTAYFHKLVAKVMNKKWGRWENFWSSEPTCVTRLVTMEDVFDKVIYTLANPVAANLIASVSKWFGSTSLEHLDGKPRQYNRPKIFFKKEGSEMPEQVTLRTIRPPGLSSSVKEWGDRIRNELGVIERRARDERKRTGKSVLDPEKILNVRVTDSPKNATSHRKLRPCLACKDVERRIEELGKLKAFRIAYREARLAYKKGDRTVKFPAGTYQLARELRVRCKPLPRC